MQTLNYWKQFLNTGRIEDYLSCVNKDRPHEGESGQSGEKPYAGNDMRDRNDIETNAYWRV